MEKIVREYFPYITETESTTFTDCVKCLITFTRSKFDSDVSFNAIAFLRFCALKLAEGGLFCNEDSQDANSYDISGDGEASDRQNFASKDENISFWMPLLTGKTLYCLSTICDGLVGFGLVLKIFFHHLSINCF